MLGHDCPSRGSIYIIATTTAPTAPSTPAVFPILFPLAAFFAAPLPDVPAALVVPLPLTPALPSTAPAPRFIPVLREPKAVEVTVAVERDGDIEEALSELLGSLEETREPLLELPEVGIGPDCKTLLGLA